jgi:hypothetical protein
MGFCFNQMLSRPCKIKLLRGPCAHPGAPQCRRPASPASPASPDRQPLPSQLAHGTGADPRQRYVPSVPGGGPQRGRAAGDPSQFRRDGQVLLFLELFCGDGHEHTQCCGRCVQWFARLNVRRCLPIVSPTPLTTRAPVRYTQTKPTNAHHWPTLVTPDFGLSVAIVAISSILCLRSIACSRTGCPSLLRIRQPTGPHTSGESLL